jgi:hypothetical protein
MSATRKRKSNKWNNCNWGTEVHNSGTTPWPAPLGAGPCPQGGANLKAAPLGADSLLMLTVLDSVDVSNEAKGTLETVYISLNPFKLKRKIDDKLRAIFHIVRLPNP